VPVYLGVVVLARLRALRRALLAEFDGWERDATSRSRDARAERSEGSSSTTRRT
jgi:hypothetical protein